MAYQSRCEKTKVFKIIWESFKSICWKRVWVSQHLPWGHIARTLSIHANSVHLSSANLIYPLLSMENPWNLCLKFWITPTSLTKPWAICLQLSSCDSIIFVWYCYSKVSWGTKIYTTFSTLKLLCQWKLLPLLLLMLTLYTHICGFHLEQLQQSAKC